MLIDEDDYLAHYGQPRRSGRYPWGSGGDEVGSQLPRNMDFNDHVANQRKKGLTDSQIADGMGISRDRLHARLALIKNAAKAADISRATRLKENGLSYVAIGEAMGRNESSIRALLKEGEAEKADILKTTSNLLRDRVAEVKYLDVGKGTEYQLGISTTKMRTAVAMLQEEGYNVHPVKILQQGTNKETELKVLVAPGVTQREVFLNKNQIRQITDFSEDGGRSYAHIQPPIQVDAKRVAVKYGPDGGAQMDGVIFVRPGVSDLSLGQSQYAQVRIAVGDGHYLKGMAMHNDNLPPGVDLLFNTNKKDTGNKLDAMKEIDKTSPENPFGTIVRQIKDPNNNDRVISAMNIVHEEGDWTDWSKTISTQMLSKQSPALARSQLNMTYEQHLKEFEDISNLTNATVRKSLLEKFGDSMDSSAVHLEAAALDQRQAWHAILPISSMPPTQVYAPNFHDGERVVLIRFPHAGTFEIPELVVNNNHPEAKRLLGDNPRDAVGIHHSVAERLSGADFDGDTVLVIPNNSGKIKTTPALEDLKNFDPRSAYRAYPGMPKMTARQKGIEMGLISNLITDMTIQAAPVHQMARAVKHSMVVIDAENHHLNYKQSALDNNIGELKQRYQGKKTGGAATLISRATAELRVPERKARPAQLGGSIDKETGRREFVPTNRPNFRTGTPTLEKSTRLAETTDAHTLLSKGGVGTPMERLYADHSNKLKALANRARKDSVNTPHSKRDASAAKVYASEVKRLNDSLALAEAKAPLERQAQIFAASTIKAKRDSNPGMDQATEKKVKFLALEEARNRTGVKKSEIVIDQAQWNAIQAGAVSPSKLNQILNHADLESVRKLATPRTQKLMTPTATNRAKTMLASGFTRAEVARQLGVSLSTLDDAT